MSINFDVYSANKTPIQINELVSQCETRGWIVVVVRNRERRTPIRRGTLKSGDMVYGWLEENGESSRLELAVHDKDRSKKLWQQGVLGALEVWITSPFDALSEFDSKTREEIRKARGEEYFEHLLASRVQYETRTSSGRNNSALDLQLIVAASILRLRGGMYDDPQSDTYQLKR